MPHTRSARKRIRQSNDRRLSNRSNKTFLKTRIKKFLGAVESGSGARYSDGTTTFWNKGDEALVEVDDEIVYQNCVAQ